VILVEQVTVLVAQGFSLQFWEQIIIGQAVVAAAHIHRKLADTVDLGVAVAVQAQLAQG
jgi:hypothetical protein